MNEHDDCSLYGAMRDVHEFMQAKGLLERSPPKRLTGPPPDGDHVARALRAAFRAMGTVIEILKYGTHDAGVDTRTFRCAFMAEELAETIEAMAAGDEIALADGLADLLYVVLGTAIQLDIPLAHVFDEVHRSNMTKVTASAENPLLKMGKGGSYEPPNIVAALLAGRGENG